MALLFKYLWQKTHGYCSLRMISVCCMLYVVISTWTAYTETRMTHAQRNLDLIIDNSFNEKRMALSVRRCLFHIFERRKASPMSAFVSVRAKAAPSHCPVWDCKLLWVTNFLSYQRQDREGGTLFKEWKYLAFQMLHSNKKKMRMCHRWTAHQPKSINQLWSILYTLY